MARSQAGEKRDMDWAVEQAEKICGRTPTKEELRKAHNAKRGRQRGPRDREELLEDLLDAMGCTRDDN
jgi:hypothetical protein